MAPEYKFLCVYMKNEEMAFDPKIACQIHNWESQKQFS